MHRCLQIAELVQHILFYLSHRPISVLNLPQDDAQPRINKRTLLAFALTSKLFLEPGLDALWSFLDNSEHIFYCLSFPERKVDYPSGGRDEREDYSLWSYYADNSMFKYYAHRVKGLKVRSDDLDPPIIRALNSSQSCLFPKLRYLWWNDFKYESLPGLKPFAGPALKSLRLSLSPWPGKVSDTGGHSESEGSNSEGDNALEKREWEKVRKSLYDIFSYVGQAAHNLEELSLVDNYEESFPGCGEQSSLILSAMPLVPCVVLWNELSDETLSSLSKMPNLRSLACYYYYSPDDCNDIYSVWDGLTLGEQTLEFGALRDLTWRVTPLQDLTRVLRLFAKNRDIAKIKAIVHWPYTPTELTAFLQALQATCSASVLTSITLEIDEEELLGQPFARASTLLKPSFTFSRIEECTLAGCAIEWDDAFLDALSLAWTGLRRLTLYDGGSWSVYPSKLTLPGLVPIARRCSHLEALSVPIRGWDGCILPNSAHDLRRHDGIRQFPQTVVKIPQLRLNRERRTAAIAYLTDIFLHADIHLPPIAPPASPKSNACITTVFES